MSRFLAILLVVTLITSNLTAQKRDRDSVAVTIRLDNSANHKAEIDSVYIIFDRYDLAGPGMVRKVYRPENNKIRLDKVPKGKYYIDVYCMGRYQQHFTRVRMIHPRANSLLKFNLKEQLFYQIGTAYIPHQKVDFSRLSINR